MVSEQVQVDQKEVGYVLAMRERRHHHIHRDTHVRIVGLFEMLEYLHPNPDDLPRHPRWFPGHLVRFQDAADIVSKISMLVELENLLWGVHQE